LAFQKVVSEIRRQARKSRAGGRHAAQALRETDRPGGANWLTLKNDSIGPPLALRRAEVNSMKARFGLWAAALLFAGLPALAQDTRASNPQGQTPAAPAPCPRWNRTAMPAGRFNGPGRGPAARGIGWRHGFGCGRGCWRLNAATRPTPAPEPAPVPTPK